MSLTTNIPTEHGILIPDWYYVALQEIGVKERPGLFKDNPRILEYHALTKGGKSRDAVAWCSSFVHYPLHIVGIEGTGSKAARSWLDWGKPLHGPKPGCIAIFWRGRPNGWKGHVGLYVRQSESHIYVLGGNQKNAVSVAPRPRKELLGYRWPILD